MALVFVAGAETLTIPISLAPTNLNTARYYAVYNKLVFELKNLFTTGYMTALAGASDSNLVMFFTGLGGYSIVPIAPLPQNQITPNVSVATASAITSLSPNLIISVGGGLNPNATRQAAIATLFNDALAAGIRWRDIQDIPTPSLAFISPPTFEHAPAANMTLPGQIFNYAGAPTLQFSLDGGAFAALPSGSSTTQTTFSLRLTTTGLTGAHTVTVRDSGATFITATVPMSIA